MCVYKNIIFDLGGVLIDWNPEYVYLKEFNKNISELSSKYIEDRKLTSCEKFLQFHNNIK